jgi:hypothetical protein
MPSIRPENLTTEELVRYAWLHQENLTREWVLELIKRLEATVDDNK